jgi:hypothetical protein
MQATPLFLTACALASIGGVVSGATINTRLIQHGGVGTEEINRPAIAFDASDTGLSDQVALPDHYALNTPAGRFEVGELSNRGLYAQRRFGWREAQFAPPPEAPLPEPAADPGWSYGSTDGQAQPVAEQLPSSTEQAVPAPDLQPVAGGQARLIVVQPALAGA